MWKDEWTERLKAFAERRHRNHRRPHRYPQRKQSRHPRDRSGTSLAALTGTTVEEFGRLAGPGNDGLFEPYARDGSKILRGRHLTESVKRRYSLRIGNHEVDAGHMYELLAPTEGTETRARGRQPLYCRPAGNHRPDGREGQGDLCRHLPDGSPVPLLFDEVFDKAGVTPLLVICRRLEVTMREGDGRKLLFILNTTDTPRQIGDPPNGVDLLGGVVSQNSVSLEPYGCAVPELGVTAMQFVVGDVLMTYYFTRAYG